MEDTDLNSLLGKKKKKLCLNQHLRPAASATAHLLGRSKGVFRRVVVFITKHCVYLEPIGLVQSG